MKIKKFKEHHIVEKAKLSDIDGIHNINTILGIGLKNFPWDKKHWIKKEIDNFYVIKEGKIVVAAICIMMNKKESYIETIAVSEDYQGLGLGKDLVNFAAKLAKKFGKKILTVESFCEYEALDFYQRCGFILKGKAKMSEEYKKPYYSFYMNL